MPKSVVGKVSHFFGKIGVAALSMSGDLKIGDHIRFEHKDGSLVHEERVVSMQINHKPVTHAGPGDDVATDRAGMGKLFARAVSTRVLMAGVAACPEAATIGLMSISLHPSHVARRTPWNDALSFGIWAR